MENRLLDCLNRVSNVGIILLVQILASPARGEDHLSSHAIRAVVIEKGGSVKPFWVTLMTPSVVLTDEIDSLIGKVACIVSLPVWTACDHAEAFRERYELLLLWARPLQIVDLLSRRNGLVGLISLVVVVQVGLP